MPRETLRVARVRMETHSVAISSALWTVILSAILSAAVYACKTWKQEDGELLEDDDDDDGDSFVTPVAPAAPAVLIAVPPSNDEWELVNDDDDDYQFWSPGGRSFKTVPSSRARKIRLQYHRHLKSLQ